MPLLLVAFFKEKRVTTELLFFPVKEFSAVILYHHPVLQYYKEKYTGGSNPPDCGSFLI